MASNHPGQLRSLHFDPSKLAPHFGNDWVKMYEERRVTKRKRKRVTAKTKAKRRITAKSKATGKAKGKGTAKAKKPR